MARKQEFEELTLASLGGGAAMELFDEEVKRVVQNILDPNTNAEAVREITIKVKMKPGPDRNEVSTEIQATAKLAAQKSHSAPIFVGIRDGEQVAVVHNIHQLQLDWDADAATKDAERALEEDKD